MPRKEMTAPRSALLTPREPKEIAPLYVFFFSEGDSSYITGEVVTLLGGETTS